VVVGGPPLRLVVDVVLVFVVFGVLPVASAPAAGAL
jgi:hypothetical protein